VAAFVLVGPGLVDRTVGDVDVAVGGFPELGVVVAIWGATIGRT
jgi:hypothetical protein